MSQTTPQVADTDEVAEGSGASRVRILLVAVEGADLDAARAIVSRQVYEPEPAIVLVGETDGDVPDDVATAATLDEAILATDPSVDYLWLLHADARPRPDALGALVSELERNEASLAGSKLLVAGTMDELESVGGATDVFGEPYSGLDEGEIDLQQYDVVREVAFVTSASMLIRRDLAQGLRGLDPLLPPVAAGLDFSQRTRLAGGRVIAVPSSEVYHQGRCGEGARGWREQAGRLRAMVTAYRPLTLLWVLPYDFIVSMIYGLASLLLGRGKPLARNLYSWAWNTYHLPSTIKQRRRLRSVRAEGDEELFRFQAKGSVRLRVVGEEISGRLLSVFDDDQALARGSRRVRGSPGIWAAVISAIAVMVAAGSIVFVGVPDVGFTFPFEAPSVALDRWYHGWNASGLGSPAPVHPSVGLIGAFSWLWFGAEGAARTILTVGLALLGIVGMGRLGGRIGLRGPGRYLAGIVLIAGPGTAVLVSGGSWLALCAAAVLPWAVRSAFIHPHQSNKSRLTNAGWALLAGLLLAPFSPLLAVAPLITVLIWRALGGDRGSFLLAVIVGVGGVAGLSFLMGDPGWITDASRRLGLGIVGYWPILILLAAAPLVGTEGRPRTFALTGGVLSLAALTATHATSLVGPGLEEALMITGSFGAGMVVAAALDSLSANVLRLTAGLAAAVIVVLSIVSLANGRLGLPSGDINSRLSFATTLAGEGGPGRILEASVDRSSIPGEVRSGPGFFYRLLDADGTTMDEVWLPEPRAGDDELATALADIASGAELRPGDRLAPFAVDWVVLEGPAFVLDKVLVAQLDLAPVPLDPGSRVYQNNSAAPLAGTAEQPWTRVGDSFEGPPVDAQVGLAVNFDRGWRPNSSRAGWSTRVDGSEGVASFAATGAQTPLALVVMVLLAGAFALIVVGRRRS